MMRRAWVPLLFLALGVAFSVESGCSRAVVPSAFTTYTAEDQSFQCDAPAGWATTGGGKNGNYNATFSSGGAEISVTVDVMGSVLGDMANTANRMAGTEDVPELSPLVQAHERNAQGMAEELSNFKDLNTVDVRLPIGEAKKSEYTASGSLGGQQHGYRVSSLLTSQRLLIICQCPDSEWKALQPVFDRVIASVTHGR
jgi:hypothetical protein